MVQAVTLNSITFPVNMSPELALGLAKAMTGVGKAGSLSKFLATSLLHCSWTSKEPLNLQSFLSRMVDYPRGPSFLVLEWMAAATIFIAKGAEDEIPEEDVIHAKNQADQWKRELHECKTSALTQYEQSLVLLKYHCTSSPEAHNLLSEKLQNVLARQTLPAQKNSAPEAAPSIDLKKTTQRGNVEVRRFNNPAEALQFLFKLSNATPPPQAIATQDTPAHPIECQSGPAEPIFSGPQLQLFDPSHALAVARNFDNTNPGEGNALLRRTLFKMAHEHGVRPLTETQTASQLDSLYKRFPHFSEVLDHIQGCLALARCGDEGSPVRISPILLKGDPGSGKTYFAQELAKALQVTYVERDLSVTTDALVLSGMDSGWKNSKPGIVFDSLVNGKTANPLICLNEVDKAKNSHSGNSPMSALYSLLEPTSAKRFVDEFVPVSVDASQVIWVLTANHGDIPEPVLSRLEVFDIRMPNTQELRAIAQSVWLNICENLLPKGHGFDLTLSEEILDALISLSPRSLRKALTTSASVAAMNGRKTLEASDFHNLPSRYKTSFTRAPMGFFHD